MVETLYFPSISVMEPLVVPFSITFTPIKGSPDWSLTTPVIVIFCANNWVVNSTNRIEIRLVRVIKNKYCFRIFVVYLIKHYSNRLKNSFIRNFWNYEVLKRQCIINIKLICISNLVLSELRWIVKEKINNCTSSAQTCSQTYG